MVNAVADDQEANLEERLDAEWNTMMQNQSSAAQFLSESNRKDLGADLGQIAFFNNKLVSDTLSLLSTKCLIFVVNFCLVQDINRFFLDEGDQNDVPKVFFSKSNEQQQEDGEQPSGASQQQQQEPPGGDDLFEDALEDALCVFKSGGANTDLLKENAG